MTTCRAAIASACQGDIWPVRVVSGKDARRTFACRACRETAARLGLDVRDDRPEWLRRGTAKDLTGAVR